MRKRTIAQSIIFAWLGAQGCMFAHDTDCTENADCENGRVCSAGACVGAGSLSEGSAGGSSSSPTSTTCGTYDRTPYGLDSDTDTCADCYALGPAYECAMVGYYRDIPYCYVPCTSNAQCSCDSNAPVCRVVDPLIADDFPGLGTFCNRL